ncbi:MAG: 3-deoxy-D-manno-octulosonic acid transferase [Nitrospira sp.]|nr:3-deoxy-D-manno-octulosonic acid transferase [Nitrospira sp.]
MGVLLAKPRCRPGFLQRIGWQLPISDGTQPSRPLVWVHAVSLGEVVAVSPLVKALHEHHPEFRYIVTTVTETGREAVEQRLKGIAEHRYAPLDFTWAVGRMIRHMQPMLYVFVETELWPNLLWALHDHGVPSVLVNGRLSSRSFGRQDLPLIRSFYRTVLQTLTLCLMQSDRDQERIVALGAEPSRVHVTGNIKFDQPLSEVKAEASLRQSFGVEECEQLILGGSTHAGEEELLASAYAQIVKKHPDTVLMVAPRHIERAEKVEAMFREAGFAVERRSRIQSTHKGPRVIILDTRGELARAYRDAVVAFVGGTLIPVGGHNLLEPAVWGTPVMFGPYTDHCAEIATLLSESGGGRRVMGVEDLVVSIEEWIRQPDKRNQDGQVAKQVVLDNQGALMRSLEQIEQCIRTASSYSDHSVTTGAGPLVVKP